ncbi:MAG: hypothetical protein WCH99_13660 [Verrucomicrobiota bacterium]
MPNKITGANADERHLLPRRTRWDARVAQFWRSTKLSKQERAHEENDIVSDESQSSLTPAPTQMRPTLYVLAVFPGVLFFGIPIIFAMPMFAYQVRRRLKRNEARFAQVLSALWLCPLGKELKDRVDELQLADIVDQDLSSIVCHSFTWGIGLNIIAFLLVSLGDVDVRGLPQIISSIGTLVFIAGVFNLGFMFNSYSKAINSVSQALRQQRGSGATNTTQQKETKNE